MQQENLFVVHRPETSWKPPASLPDLSPYSRLGFDTETDGINPHKSQPIGISICTPDYKKYYIPFGHKGGGNLDKNLVRRWVQRELRGKDLVGLNVKFDNHMMLNWDVSLEKQGNRLHDVAFKAALINENRYSGFNLEALANEFLPNPEERKVHPCTVDPKDFHHSAAGEIALRAESDAFLAFRIDEESQKEIVAQDLQRVLDLEDSLIYAVGSMERNGARINVDKLEQWRKNCQSEYEAIILKIHRETGLRVNPDKPVEMQALFDKYQLPFPRTADGSPSFEAKFLKSVQNPYVQMAARARKLKSIKSKYLDKYAKAIYPGDILRYDLHQLRGNEYGTITGRFACANVNIQQVMKVEKQIEDLFEDYIIRELFIPSPGMMWLSADAAQIEFRLFGHYANSKHLNEAYSLNPMIDFHQLVCEMLQRVRPDFTRRRAKNINFGVLYGMGKDKMARELGVEMKLAIEMLETYHAEFPEARRLMNQAAKLAEQRGWVKTYMGRRRRYPDRQRLHSALNAVIQGTAADYMKIKIKELYDAREDLEFTMRMTVHDEVDGDIPSPGHAKKIEELLNSQSLPLRVPLLWDVETGTDWRLEQAA
jgi:DNA polymerase-1